MNYKRSVISTFGWLSLACTVHPVHAQPDAVELELVGTWTEAWVYDVEIVNELAYVASETNGFYVIDGDNQSAPGEVGGIGMNNVLPVDGGAFAMDCQRGKSCSTQSFHNGDPWAK